MFYLRKYQMYFSTALIHSRNWLISTKESLTLNLNIIFASYVWKKIQRTSFWLVNFFKTDCFFCLHIYHSKMNINCLIKDLKLFSIHWTTSLSTNEDHSSKTKQIKSQGIFTLFWQLITHFASQFHQSIYEVALEFTAWWNLFW